MVMIRYEIKPGKPRQLPRHKKGPNGKKFALLRRQGNVCAECGSPMILEWPADGRCLPDTATIDHVVPRALGGSNKLKNLELVHSRCNQNRATALGLSECRKLKRMCKSCRVNESRPGNNKCEECIRAFNLVFAGQCGS